MKKSIYQSPLGSLVLVVDNGYLVYCNWVSSDCEYKLRLIEQKLTSFENSLEDDQLTMEIIRQLNDYFKGRLKEFNIPVKFYGSDFQLRVWKELENISYGHTISYKALAEKCGNDKAFRAVARACGQNPVSVIVPCHRVIGSDFTSGGYTGGLEKKVALLKLENQSLNLVERNKKDKNHRIDLAE